jgi:hypothetical protein
MKKTLFTLILVGGLLASPTTSKAWVASRTTVTRGGVHHTTTYRGGYSCGGVSTGTAVAAGVIGFAAGAVVGSAVAKSKEPAPASPPPTTTVVVAPAPAPTATVVVTPPPVVVPPTAPVGSIYTTLPAGAKPVTINGKQYYVLSSTYYQPYFGKNGVYYTVVPSPI